MSKGYVEIDGANYFIYRNVSNDQFRELHASGSSEAVWTYETSPVRVHILCYSCGAVLEITGHHIFPDGKVNDYEEGEQFCVHCDRCEESNYPFLKGWKKVPARVRRLQNIIYKEAPAE